MHVRLENVVAFLTEKVRKECQPWASLSSQAFGCTVRRRPLAAATLTQATTRLRPPQPQGFADHLFETRKNHSSRTVTSSE